MKRMFLLVALLCFIAAPVSGQGKFLKGLKKGFESVTGIQVSEEPVFVYPEIGAWKMSLVGCDGNAETGEVILCIKAMPLLLSPGTGVNCYILSASDADGRKLAVASWGSTNRYDLPLLSNTTVEFQSLTGVSRTVKTINVKFIIGIETTNNTFELRNVPVNWSSNHSNTLLSVSEKVTTETTITETITTDSLTVITELGEVWSWYDQDESSGTLVSGGGFDIAALRTGFFHFEDPDGELEAVDMDLFDESQFVYSLAVGLKDSRFPVERAYEGFGDVVEDARTKDFYMKHMAKCYVVAENGQTPLDEREAITGNYLSKAIGRFVSDNLDGGSAFFSGDVGELNYLRQNFGRNDLVLDDLFMMKILQEQPFSQSMDEGVLYYADYIKNHPPKKSQIHFMGDDNATKVEFEYRFYDYELALHAFFFSPITLHYEMRSWYDKDYDVTVYACFYCVGYDNAAILQALGNDSYRDVKDDFKTRNNLDFDLYPIQCLMIDVEKMLVMEPNPPKVENIVFIGPLTWKYDGKPMEKKKVVKQTVTTEPVAKKTVSYEVSPNSAMYLRGINPIDIAEDEGFVYLTGIVKGRSKLLSIEKSSGVVTEMYEETYDKGSVKRLMEDRGGKVLVEFLNHPVMACSNGKLEETKLVFSDQWANYYPYLKGIMPGGDVLMIRSGPENILVDRNTGAIKATSKEMSFGEPRGTVIVTDAGVIWEQGSGAYNLVEGFGITPQPTITKLDTGYSSAFKGGVDEIKLAPDGSIFIASSFGLHKSSDDGKTWKAIKSPYAYGSFDHIATTREKEVWTSINSSNGYCVVRYDDNLNGETYRVSEFDVPGSDGKLKLQTKPRIIFSDSLGNLWALGGTYSMQGVLVFNPGGIKGYTSLAGMKILMME